MKFTSIASVIVAATPAVLAIPAFVTVSCPDAVTITQTVYPPGWGPTSYGAAQPPPASVQGQVQPAAAPSGPAGVTTSYAPVVYATYTTSVPAPGVYPAPSGMGKSLTAYMPGIITYSPAYTTAYVFNNAEATCTNCVRTVIVIVITDQTIGIYNQYWTVNPTTTIIQNYGAASTVTSVPTNLTPAGGSGNTAVPPGTAVPGTGQYGKGYPTVTDFGIFTPSPISGFSIVSASNSEGGPRVPTITFSLGSNAPYPSITSADYSGTKIFQPSAISGFSIVSASNSEGGPRVPTITFSLGPTANYKSISDYNTAFVPSAIPGFSIVSASAEGNSPNTPASVASYPTSSAGGYGANYPSVNMATFFNSVAGSTAAYTQSSSAAPPSAAAPSSSAAAYGANYPSVNMNTFFNTLPGATSTGAAPSTVVPTTAATPPTSSAAPSRYGANYPSVNMGTFFNTLPGATSTSAAPPAVAASAPAATTAPGGGGSGGGYGAHYPSINYDSAFTSIPTYIGTAR